jgi:hypothetical protein
MANFPTSGDITHKVEGVTGEFYKPTTTWGEYARTLGNYAPGAAMGPAGWGRKVVQQVAVPGFASETAGQATKGTPFEPWARGAAGVVSPWAVNRTVNLAAPRQVIPSAEDIHAAASRGYREIRNLGVEINPTGVVPVANRVEQELLNRGLTQGNSPETYGVLRNLQNPPAVAPAVPGGPPPPRVVMTTNDFENARQELVQTLYGKDGRDKAAALHAIRALDDYLANIPAADVLRGDAAQASRLFRETRGNWGAMLRANAVEGKIELGDLNAATAHAGANTDNATRQAMKQLIRPNTQGNTIAEQIGANPEEIAGMNRVARGTNVGNTARYFGKLAPQGVHSVTAHTAAAAATGGYSVPVSAGLYAAKKIGDFSTARHARQLDELVRSRSPLAQAMPRTMNNYQDTRAAAIARAYEGARSGDDEPRAAGGAVINDPNPSPSEQRFAGLAQFADSQHRPMDEQILNMIPPVPGRADGGEVLESTNIEDRRGEPYLRPWGEVWEDMKRNNVVSRWLRGGQYAGPDYEYLPHGKMDDNDPMTRALGGDQIPVTTYGTTHPLKRYNPAYNSDKR